MLPRAREGSSPGVLPVQYPSLPLRLSIPITTAEKLPFSARSWPEVVSLGVSVDGERGMGLLTCSRYGCSWPSCSLHPKGDKHGEAGTSYDITLRPGVLLRRSREDIFVRAAVLVGPLLDEPEEFCATSLKTLLLLLKRSGLGTLLPTSPSSPDTPAGATLAREREQPSLSSLQQGKSDSPPSLQATAKTESFAGGSRHLALIFSFALVRRSPLCHLPHGLGRCP